MDDLCYMIKETSYGFVMHWHGEPLEKIEWYHETEQDAVERAESLGYRWQELSLS